MIGLGTYRTVGACPSSTTRNYSCRCGQCAVASVVVWASLAVQITKGQRGCLGPSKPDHPFADMQIRISRIYLGVWFLRNNPEALMCPGRLLIWRGYHK